jgi:hypothetical protein
MMDLRSSMDDAKFLAHDVRAQFTYTSTLVPCRSIVSEALSSVTRFSGNFETLQQTLLTLPLQHCTDEEIAKIAQGMYDEGARPCGYHAEFASLIASMKTHTAWWRFGDTLCKVIVDSCMRQFDQRLNKAGKRRTDAEKKMKKLATPLCANLKFLGHLFLNGIVAEAKIIDILSTLLCVGKKHTEQELFEYEFAMICDLLIIVIEQLTPTASTEFIPVDMVSPDEISVRPIRVVNQFLLEHIIQSRNKESVGKCRFKTMPSTRRTTDNLWRPPALTDSGTNRAAQSPRETFYSLLLTAVGHLSTPDRNLSVDGALTCVPDNNAPPRRGDDIAAGQ